MINESNNAKQKIKSVLRQINSLVLETDNEDISLVSILPIKTCPYGSHFEVNFFKTEDSTKVKNKRVTNTTKEVPFGEINVQIVQYPAHTQEHETILVDGGNYCTICDEDSAQKGGVR